MKLLVDPPAVREAYVSALQKFIEGYEKHARESGLEYRVVDTSTPVAKTLLSFLERRQRLGGGAGRRRAR